MTRTCHGLLFLVGSLAFACGTGGRYGYARTYIPTSEEEDAVEGATEYDPVMAERREEEWVGRRITVFGVIKSLEPSAEGDDVVLSVRNLQKRNLCLTDKEDTCRVTVTDHEFATLHAFVKLNPNEEKLGPGSLLRVVGPLMAEPHPRTGNRVLRAEFYRHWPGGEFVTLRQREFLRQ